MYRSVSFPVQLARPIDGMILGSRMAVADILRRHAREAVQRSTDAGVDGVTTGQRMVMEYVAACRASRFLRAFPGSVARWCFQHEQHAVQLASESYPSAPVMTVGGYGMGWLSIMPAGVILLSAGGVRASGALPAATGDEPAPAIVPHEVREVRITRAADLDGAPSYSCTVIMSADSGARDMHEDPVDGQPLVMEPEDQ